MQVKRVSYTESATITVKRFESIKPIISMEAELNEHDRPEDALKYLKNSVRQELKVAMTEIKASIPPE